MMYVRARRRCVALLAAVLLAGAWPAAAQGSFTAVGPLRTARALHTMTTLADGSVLVAGGEDRQHVFESLSTAEIYDPVSRTFSFTANSMQMGRSQHTATRLASGKVLLTGGANQACCRFNGNYGDRPNSTADVYDPVARTFAATANNMSIDRHGHSATRLADGRVLVTGGVTDINFSSFASSADIYDPATNSFTPTGNMTVPRYSHASVLLADGTVLIVGGSQSSTSAEIYDPVTGTFSPTANPPAVATRTPRAFLVANGTVIIFGHNNLVQKYDPATQTFAVMPVSLFNHGFWAAVAPLADGRILLADDFNAELYDPSTGLSVAAGNPGVGDIFPVAATLPGGGVLLTGGENFVPFTFVSLDAASLFMPNGAPVANAGGDVQVSPGAGCLAPMALNGSASTDPDGDALTYTWSEGATALGTGATLTVSLGPGTHEITLTVTDGHGGTSTDTVAVVIADTTAPTFTVPAAVTLEQSGPAGTTYVPMIPAATDNCDPAPAVAVAGIPAGGLFPAGPTTLTYTATDAAGNETVDATTVTVGDTTAPTLTVPAALSAEAASAAGAAVTFSVGATDAVTLSPAVTCAPTSGATFALGNTTVTCEATDAAGNAVQRSFVVTVADTTAPSLVVPAAAFVEAGSAAGALVEFAVSATDAVTAIPSVTCLPASGTVFPLGSTPVSCAAQDASGNGAAATFVVTVRDTTAPTLVVPAAMVVEASDAVGTTVGYDVTASDLVTSSPVVVCTPPSGSAFSIGVHTVSCTATDAAGNAATQTFTVSVTDNPTPGHIHGGGRVMSGVYRYDFNFSVLELDSGMALGRFKLQVCQPAPARRRGQDVNDFAKYKGRGEDDEDDDDRNDHDFDRHDDDEHKCVGPKSRFVASTVTFSRFTNNPAIVPGYGAFQRRLVDTVVFAGTGLWNGQPGYRYEVRATDQGEPGRTRDTFAVTITAPAGAVVATANASLVAGNVQSTTGFNILNLLRED